jgi:hypothetical protein
VGEGGVDGVYYVPNPDTGCFDVYQNGVKIEETQISYVYSGVITAVKTQDKLQLYGVAGGAGAYSMVEISLNAYLKSLVFRPEVYFDGIETIIYPWLEDTTMVKRTTAYTDFQNHQNRTVYGFVGLINKLNDYTADTKIDWWGNYYLPTTAVDRHAYPAASQLFHYGPAISVNYHMNPSTAKVVWSDIKGYNVLEPEVIYYNTRASKAQLGITSPEKDYHGTSVFGKTADGILKAGLQIQNPNLLNTHPTLEEFNGATNWGGKDNTIALQVATEEGDITSDYALLYPEKLWVEALVYTKQQQYTVAGTTNHGNVDENARTTITSNYAGRVSGGTRVGDLNGTFDTSNQVHVWDTPQGALQDPDGAALELYWNSDNGITLRDYLGIHYVQENVKKMNNDYTYPLSLKTWFAKDYDEEKWGLYYEFRLVDYQVGTNKTRDSRYAEMVDSKTGKVVAWNVDYTQNHEGTTIKTHSQSAIGREPLVQVLVKNTKGDVVLDGYILLHISDEIPPLQPNKDVIYPTRSYTFDLCNAGDVATYYWDEFSKIVLTDTLNNMTKEQFDEVYVEDFIAGTKTAGMNPGDVICEMKQWDANWSELETGNPANTTTLYLTGTGKTKLGQIFYVSNDYGTTNHRFYWTISESELEKLTHHTTLPVTVSRWIRFQIDYSAGNYAAALAPYPYVYIKLSTTIDRKYLTDNFGLKNDNYWYNWDWNANVRDGWSAIVFDINEPRDGAYINQYVGKIRKTLLGNAENTSGAVQLFGNNSHKYFFAPKDVIVNGVKITTQSPDNTQKNYNKLFCKYINSDNNNAHTFNATEKADHTWEWDTKYKKLLDECAIDYNNTSCAFTNKYLYANNTRIAELDQETGEITLLKNATTKAILNAVGYEGSNHENINRELRAWVAMASSNECGVAKVVSYDKTADLYSFMTSWQCPINMKEIADDAVLDANTNGNVIYLIDKIKLYDWRGDYPATQGYMYAIDDNDMTKNHFWFWAYYNVKSITINMSPSAIQTNMHSGTFKPMSQITTEAELYAWPSRSKSSVTYSFDLLNGSDGQPFNYASKEADIEAYMGVNPVNYTNKERFGAIYYANNGDNVTEFDIKVPVTIEYEWGSFTKNIKIHIDATHGNNQ